MSPWSSKHLVVVGSALALTALAGCSSGKPTAPLPDLSPSAPSSTSGVPTNGIPVSFKSTLRSTYKKLDTVGPNGSQTYGFNVLEGTTKINDRTVKVRMLGTVDYNNGDGPFGGFLELIWSDGTTIAMRQDGMASLDKATKKTQFSARVDVIAGTKAAVGVDGSGEWTGSRTGSVGTSVAITVNLTLTGAPEALTGIAPGTRPTPTGSYNATIEP